jgi:hypothetical protein
MSTFAGQMDFEGPQPNNMEIEPPERDLYPKIKPGVKVKRAPVPPRPVKVKPSE